MNDRQFKSGLIRSKDSEVMGAGAFPENVFSAPGAIPVLFRPIPSTVLFQFSSFCVFLLPLFSFLLLSLCSPHFPP